MTSLSLPVSGIQVGLREPTGRAELIVLEAPGTPTATILELARALVLDAAGNELEWEALPAVDLGALALLLRGAWLGQRINTGTMCPQPGCGESIDVTFSIPDYLAHHSPRRFRGLDPRGNGWFALAGTELSFRIPTIGDLVAAAAEQRGGTWLSQRCIRSGNGGRDAIRRVDRALSAIAPRLDDHVSGTCPSCGQSVELFFDPVSYVLDELRDVCAGLYADVHELAFAYRWSEESILGLDRRRRHSYVAMVRGELALA
jgi:hypothetical protein